MTLPETSKHCANKQYRGRFAPSPTGPLHKGSLLTALASFLDAKAHNGKWMVRIEDIDQTRCKTEWANEILLQLMHFGLHSDEPIVLQNKRLPLYEKAFEKLKNNGLIYPCSCSRKQLQLMVAQNTNPCFNWQANSALHVYNGRCRKQATEEHKPLAWRLKSDLAFAIWQNQNLNYQTQENSLLKWHDRLLGHQSQNLVDEVGDFVVQRADGLFAYQLAVVVDDIQQGITDIVRGQDLVDNTARQLALYACLEIDQPQASPWRYMHIPLVLHSDGEKLSKQNGAQALNTQENPLIALNEAAVFLGLPPQDLNTDLGTALQNWTHNWHQKYIFE